MFKCNHPLKWLAVESDQTIVEMDADFDKVTTNLFCTKCLVSVKIVHAKTKQGVEHFLNSKQRKVRG